MKYIITENKLERVIIHFLNKRYGDLTEYRTDKYPNKLFFFKNDKILMVNNHNINHKLWVDYEISNDLMKWFDLNYSDMSPVIEKWVKEKFNLNIHGVGFSYVSHLYDNLL